MEMQEGATLMSPEANLNAEHMVEARVHPFDERHKFFSWNNFLILFLGYILGIITPALVSKTTRPTTAPITTAPAFSKQRPLIRPLHANRNQSLLHENYLMSVIDAASKFSDKEEMTDYLGNIMANISTTEKDHVMLYVSEFPQPKFWSNANVKHYGNRTCPVSWSKFDCGGMGVDEGNYTEYLKHFGFDIEIDWIAFLERRRDSKIFFMGDSVSRQQFVSFACSAWGMGVKMDVYAPWFDEYACKTKGCIRSGEHSGWPFACVTFTEYNIRSCQGDVFYWFASIITKEYHIHRFLSGKVVFGGMDLKKHPEMINYKVDRESIFVVNRGIHGDMNLRMKDLIELKKNIRLFNKQNPGNDLKVIYRSVSPSHFGSRSGEYMPGRDNINHHCVKNPDYFDSNIDPLYQFEKSLFTDAREVFFLDINPIARKFPMLHIGEERIFHGADCVHWCTPGMPDIWNDMLVAMDPLLPF